MERKWQINKRKLFRRIARIFFYSALVVVVALLGLTIWAQISYLDIVNDAKEKFHKSKVESLLAVAESDTISLAERNKSIWALGILKDKSALPRLEGMVIKGRCDHLRRICQYELNKAILKIQRKYKGEIISSWVIR